MVMSVITVCFFYLFGNRQVSIVLFPAVIAHDTRGGSLLASAISSGRRAKSNTRKAYVMLDVSVAVLLGLLGLAFALWYRHRRNLMGTFKRLNIPGPEPHFLFGNLREFVAKKPAVAHREWSAKYGKIFGYYFGAYPVLVIGDADLLRNVQIKDIQNFINRPELVPGGLNAGKLFNLHVLKQRGQKWKNMRAILTPSFTSGKMKMMSPIVNESIGDFLSRVGEYSQADKEFDIYAMYKALTLDVIGRTAFGIRTQVQKNPKTDEFLLAVQDAVREDSLGGLAALSSCLPELAPILGFFRLVSGVLKNLSGKSRLAELASNCHAILKSRRANPENRRQDLLQLMLDAQLSQEELKAATTDSLTIGYESDVKRQHLPAQGGAQSKADQKKSYHMTDDEILSNTFIFLLAGFDTTSTTLGFTTHVLVNRPDIQDGIREEVQAIWKKDGFLDFTNVSQCKYMDQVLFESLRYYPPVSGFISRETDQDIKYGDLFIPRGSAVQIPLTIHRDPDYWTDPDTFDPERFAPENKKNHHPMAFQAFGAGPRNCIGMRFAQMEAKLALANLLLNYRLVPGEKTEMGEIEVVHKVALLNPKNGVFVKAEKVKP